MWPDGAVLPPPPRRRHRPVQHRPRRRSRSARPKPSLNRRSHRPRSSRRRSLSSFRLQPRTRPAAPVTRRAEAAVARSTPPVATPPAPRVSPREVEPVRQSRPASQPALETAEPAVEVARAEPRRDPPAAPAPPTPTFEELVIPTSSVIGLEIESSISSETAVVEDRVAARVTREVLADGRVAIPSGSRMLGTVTLVERGGKIKERARLGVRFHTLVLADGRQVDLRTDTIYREGDSVSSESSKKIGGAAIGGAGPGRDSGRRQRGADGRCGRSGRRHGGRDGRREECCDAAERNGCHRSRDESSLDRSRKALRTLV